MLMIISNLKSSTILMKLIENSFKNIGLMLTKELLKESQFMKPNGSNDLPVKKNIYKYYINLIIQSNIC